MIRVQTEHNGVREFPDDHVPEILEAATLHVMDGAGKTVLLVAEGEWRTVEVGADQDWKWLGTVSEAGGGHVTVYVDRNLDNYPEPGAAIFTRVDRA